MCSPCGGPGQVSHIALSYSGATHVMRPWCTHQYQICNNTEWLPKQMYSTGCPMWEWWAEVKQLRRGVVAVVKLKCHSIASNKVKWGTFYWGSFRWTEEYKSYFSQRCCCIDKKDMYKIKRLSDLLKLIRSNLFSISKKGWSSLISVIFMISLF